MKDVVRKQALYDVLHRWTGVAREALEAIDAGVESLVQMIDSKLREALVGQALMGIAQQEEERGSILCAIRQGLLHMPQAPERFDLLALSCFEQVAALEQLRR